MLARFALKSLPVAPYASAEPWADQKPWSSKSLGRSDGSPIGRARARAPRITGRSLRSLDPSPSAYLVLLLSGLLAVVAGALGADWALPLASTALQAAGS
jgi:hypothetical protein